MLSGARGRVSNVARNASKGLRMMSGGKDIKFGVEARALMLEGVDKLAKESRARMCTRDVLLAPHLPARPPLSLRGTRNPSDTFLHRAEGGFKHLLGEFGEVWGGRRAPQEEK